MIDSKLMTRAADNIRILAASMVEQAKSGHPGGAMGGADFVNVLFSKYIVTGEQVYYTAAQAAQDPSVQEGQLLPGVIDQQKSKGGFMLDLSIGKSIRMKKGQLSINLSLSNLLNNTKLCTGGYEQGRMNFSVNSETGETGSARLYKFDKNPKKFYAYGINGMLNISYRF